MTGGPASADPLEASRAFIDAIVWGEHRTVWDLLSEGGRKTVLSVAVTRGMDEAWATRVATNTASRGESDDFLGDLVNGLRADLAGNDLDALRFDRDPDPRPGEARVALVAVVHEQLGGGLPVGALELVETPAGWRIERLLPGPGL
ncbi:MAG: hypothetical protein ACRD0F_00135 [Acidimicrobiales bacterium]